MLHDLYDPLGLSYKPIDLGLHTHSVNIIIKFIFEAYKLYFNIKFDFYMINFEFLNFALYGSILYQI